MSCIPSVTQVLSPWSDFSKVRPDVLDEAAERGSLVHRACGAIATGLWSPPVPEEYAGYIVSFKGWFFQYVESVVIAEPELVHPVYGYCGHPDLIVRMKGDSVNTLIDLKTPAAKYKTWRIQLAAYWMLTGDNCSCGRAMSLRLRKDGATPIADEYTGSLVGDFSVFLSCLQAWKFFKGEDQ